MLVWPQYDHSMTTVWPKSLVKSAGKCWPLLTHIIHIHMVHMLSRRWRSVRWTCWRFSPPWPCNRRGFGNCIGLGWNMMKLIPNTVTMVPRLLINAHSCWLHVLTVSAYCQWVATSVFKVDRFRCHGAHEAHKCPVWPDTSSFPGDGMPWYDGF